MNDADSSSDVRDTQLALHRELVLATGNPGLRAIMQHALARHVAAFGDLLLDAPLLPAAPARTYARVCSWCPDAPARTAAAVAAGQVVTHGICPACRARIFGELP